MTKKRYTVKGMHCASCSVLIEKTLRNIEGIHEVSVNAGTEAATVSGADENMPPVERMNEVLAPLGYTLVEQASGDSHTPPAESGHEDHGAGHEHIVSPETLRLTIAITSFSVLAMIIETLSGAALIPKLPDIALEAIHHIFPVLATIMLAVPGWRYVQALGRYIRTRTANMDTLIGLGTVTAFAYSFIISAFEEPLAPYLDVTAHYYDVTIVLIGFITLGKYLETKSKRKTGQAIQSLIALQTKTAFIQTSSGEKEISIGDIHVGDTLIIKPGGKIPVDGIVFEGKPLIDESSLTGEPIPKEKQPEDRIFAGTINTSRPFLMTAQKIGKDTLLSHIVQLVEDAQNSKAPIQKLADAISAKFVPAVLIIALATLAGWLIIGSYTLPFDQTIARAITSFIGVLIIACPCAMGLATPTAIIAGVGRAASHGILIKNAEALEQLSSVNALVIDKTGTLTEGKPRIISVVTDPTVTEEYALKKLTSLESSSEHPLAGAIIAEAQKRGITMEKFQNIEAHEGKGISGETNGKHYKAGTQTFLEDSAIEISENLQNHIAEQSGSHIFLAEDKKCIAIFSIGDAIRPQAARAIKELTDARIDITMATGDNEKTAQAVARELGIKHYVAHVLPQDKQKIIKGLQSQGKRVAMAGDGINDAPALAQADVSVAMSTGTDIAIESSDITLLNGDISKIHHAIMISRATLRIIKQNLFWAFFYNIVGIPLAAGLFIPIFGIGLNPAFAGIAMALSSISVVLNALRLKSVKIS